MVDRVVGERSELPDGPDTQDRAPILEALQTFMRASPISFEMPGHHAGRGAPRAITRLVGSKAFKADCTPLKGLDDRGERKRISHRAEALAAELWGADSCFFSTAGSTLSNQVAVRAAANPGDTVLVSRNSHKSLIGALLLANVKPVFLEPRYDDQWDIDHGQPLTELSAKLEAHPGTKAVFIVSPTYFGVVPDVAGMAALCHKRGIPLVVDEAWGPHFAFHPDMPIPSIRLGADISVMSIHKTMAGLEQASVMLRKSDLIPEDRFNLAYDLHLTTSPSSLILASIDATRRQFAQEGQKLVQKTLDLARHAREKLAAIDGIEVMGTDVLDGDAAHALDETKVLIDISGLGVNGYEAEDWLIRNKKMTVGLSDERRMLLIFTVGTDKRSTQKMLAAFEDLANWARNGADDKKGYDGRLPHLSELKSELVMTPSEAFFAQTERIRLTEAEGRIAAEMVSPYPPGIPRIFSGERISGPQLKYVQESMKLGVFPYDPSDQDLHTIRVVRETG
uniref:aminotransferase class I/II-fold pyridoxal phosphate-dependent enzyme n=1 Tax=Sphingomonas sp. PL-96 TaxID=2887201 RepID=UPI001E540134|nr:aminotransferase class I/II-fold pyridoxal phosphate-dependent enzyme [Sphingomonas sp. PL-96]